MKKSNCVWVVLLSVGINYGAVGVLLAGSGQIYFDDVHNKSVSPLKERCGMTESKRPTAPLNLDVE